MAMDRHRVPNVMAMENPENLEMQQRNDAARVESQMATQVIYGLKIKKEKLDESMSIEFEDAGKENQNLEMEQDNYTAQIVNEVIAQTTYGSQIKKEKLDEGESSGVQDTGREGENLAIKQENYTAQIENEVIAQVTCGLKIKKEKLDENESSGIQDTGREDENLAMEQENYTALIENEVIAQVTCGLKIKKEKLDGCESSEVEDAGRENENLGLEPENDSAKVKHHLKEQTRDDLGIQEEILAGRDRSKIKDIRGKNGKHEVDLAGNNGLVEGEMAKEEESGMSGEVTKVKGAIGLVESELRTLENVEEVEKRVLEEDKQGEEFTNVVIKKEPVTEQEDVIVVSVSTEEIISNDVQNQELKAFKAHRWLDENFKGSDSSSDDEPGRVIKIEFGQSDSETEQPNTTAAKQHNQTKQKLRTRGEIDLEDLPPIEKLQITVGDDVKLVEVGVVLHSVGVLVVVESMPNLPPLDAETVLFLEGKKVLGKVFDTIGRVIRPCYTVRFNNVEEIEEQGIKDGMPVFYAPKSEEWTHYVFMAHLMKFRGSDASWEHDNEPPPQFVDYSDDESEKLAKAKQRGKLVENSSEAADESQGKRRKKKNTKQQQSQGFGNSVDVNKGRTNTATSVEERTGAFSSTDWCANQPLTSWPPKQHMNRPREPAMRHRWAQPQTQRSPAARFSRMPPPMIPDLNQPPPLSGHPPSQFGPPPSHIQVRTSTFSQGPPTFSQGPPTFSQGPPSSSWQSFQNAPPYSFASLPPAAQPPPFYPSQYAASPTAHLRLAFGSLPPPHPSFGPPSFFSNRGASRH